MSDIPTANTYDGRQWVPSEDYMATFEKLCDARKRVAELEIDGHVATENLRDTFAAAALTGLARAIPENSIYHQDIVANQAYGLADAMLRERACEIAKTATKCGLDHDAAPAARASVGRPRTDKADLPTRCGTGDTPVTEPMPVFVSGSGSVTPVSYARTDEKRVNWPTDRGATEPRNGALAEPVAWAVVSDSTEEIDCEFVYPDAATAGDVAMDSNGSVVPLYRSPTLTDAEREAVNAAMELVGTQTIKATLRGLLERTK